MAASSQFQRLRLRRDLRRQQRVQAVVRRRRRLTALATGQRARRRRHRYLALLIIAPVLLIGAGAGGLALAAFPIMSSVAGKVPEARTYPADTLVFDRTGALIADLHESGTSRIPVPLDQMSLWLQRAVVDVEDKNFWYEGAIDPGRIAAAAWQNLHHGVSQGASTIPMQLAKLWYLNDDRTLVYKVKEIAYANDLMSRLSKSQILESYINDSPFGETAIGAEAAARVFFGTTAAKLDLAQAAMIAGLPNAPSTDDPFMHPKAARDRQLQVLGAMLDVGDITAQDYAKAAAEKLNFADGWADNVDLTPAFVGRVYDELSGALHVDPNIAGLRVTTTLDLGLQRQAEQIVRQQVQGLHGNNVSDGALVSVDPRTGQVIAYVGSAGADVPGGQIDMARTPRQMGSTFKLFTYSTAFAEHRISMASPVKDEPIHLPDGVGKTYSPVDYDHKWHGVLPVKQALGNSLNIPAIRVELTAGIPQIVQQARALGVTTLTAEPSSYGASMTLGTYPLPLWQLAQAATAFADQGRLHHAHFVIRATDGWSGALRYQPSDSPHLAVDPAAAFLINAILTNDSNRWMEFGRGSDLTLAGHVVAAKTGTTDDFRDNLTVGWTPNLVTAAWVGNANDAPMQGTTGITGAAPIWHNFMTIAVHGQTESWAPPPAGVIQNGGDWFIAGTDPHTGAAQLTGNPNAVAASEGTTNVQTNGDCRTWDYNGASYWWCGGGSSGLPGDPGG